MRTEEAGTGWYQTISKVAAVIGITTPPVYVAFIVVLQLLNSDLSWIQYTLSDLALRPYGWIETAAACLLGVCLLAIGLGLYFNSKPTKSTAGFAAAMAVMGLAFFLVAAFQTSDSDIVTMQVIIHRAAVVTLAVAFPAACLLMSVSLRTDNRWRGLMRYCAIAGAISVALNLVTAFAPPQTQRAVAGLWEKASLANAIILCQVLGIRLFVISMSAHLISNGSA